MVGIRSELSEALPEHLRMKGELIFEEVFMNIAWHAYKGSENEPRPVEIRLSTKGSEARLVFIDQGVEFDMTKFKQQSDATSIGGHGIEMIRELSDRIEYERKDNKNTLQIYFS